MKKYEKNTKLVPEINEKSDFLTKKVLQIGERARVHVM